MLILIPILHIKKKDSNTQSHLPGNMLLVLEKSKLNSIITQKHVFFKTNPFHTVMN